MTRRLLALAALLPGLTLVGCLETDTVIEMKTIRITQPGIPVAGTALPGVPLEASTTFDLGAATEAANLEESAVVELTATSIEVTWSDPLTRPDFSGITSVTASVIPDAASGLAPAIIATYVQDPSNPDPDTVVFTGNPDANIFDLLTSGGVMTLALSAEGTVAPAVFDTTATAVVELRMLVSIDPLQLAAGGGGAK